jgi:predicted metallo-beta-lactamase superfamily hydrolase
MVNGLQARRAAGMWRAVAPVARLESADSTQHREDGVELRVSPPLPHGVEGSSLGYLVALTVIEPAERERFVFATDVQGPLSPVAAAYLTREKPTLVYLSGPPSYIEHEVGTAVIDRGIDNLLRLMDATGCRVIMDHFAVRDTAYETRFDRLWRTGHVLTAARFLGVDDTPLESRRHQLWAQSRKPAARAEHARATMPRAPRRLAKGGASE